MKGGFDERFKVLLSFTIVFIIGIPIWWKTTEITRANLPHEQIATLAADEFVFPWKIQIELVMINSQINDQQKNEFRQELKKLLSSYKPSTKSYTPELDVVVSSQTTNSDQWKILKGDELDEFLQTSFGSQSKNGVYKFFVLPSSTTSDVMLGKYRHGWVSVADQKEVTSVLPKIANQVKKHFVEHQTKQSTSKETLAVRPSPEYRLSFSLLNGDPADTIVTWEFKKAFNKYLKPMLDVLNTVANFTIDSQIIQYASLMQPPLFDSATSTYYLKSTSLPHFINPYEWKLDFTDTKTHPVLNFILYIPSKSQSPLKIKLEDGSYSATNAFSLPQFGGIVLFSPNSSSKTLRLSPEDLLPVMQLFASQLRELLGVASIDKTIVPSTVNGIAQWEVDSLMRRYTFYNVDSTIATLKSLSKLVQNLTNMVVLDNIATLCENSLESLSQTSKSLHSAQYNEAFYASRSACKDSEEAFFDPNMLAVLYFPNEHKYAIYALPFLPITFQLVTGIWGEYKSRKQAKKVKKE